jgi:hypothetical protein
LRPPERDPDDVEAELHTLHQLRSGGALTGGRVVGSDGDIGLIKDLLIDERSWAIRYLTVETGSWWPAQQVLISPQWINEVNWSDTVISVNMSRQDVRAAPHFDPKVTIDRKLEIGLHEHYGQPGYWVVEVEHAEELQNG